MPQEREDADRFTRLNVTETVLNTIMGGVETQLSLELALERKRYFCVSQDEEFHCQNDEALAGLGCGPKELIVCKFYQADKTKPFLTDGKND